MNSQVMIPNGDEKITVELTVKEAIALSGGVRFNDNQDLMSNARSKVRRKLERRLLPESDKVDYLSLEL